MDRLNQERLTFDLRERIPLEDSSKDISIIRNVEVIPEIEMIAEQNTYRINGYLLFKGQYEAIRNEENQPYVVDRSAFYNKRTIKEIDHRIPVDITLPADRVDEDGIVLEISSLDYELIDPSYIEVNTSIQLIGLKEETVQKNEHWNRINNYQYLPDDYLIHTQHVETAPPKEEAPIEEISLQIESEQEQKQVDEKANSERETEMNQESEQMEEKLGGPVAREDEKKEESMQQDPFEQEGRLEDKIEDQVGVNEEELLEQEVHVYISKEPSARLQQKENHSTEADSTQNNTARLLSYFLKDRAETKTQIKICLVQPGESLEEIASRYAVSQDEILSFNKLSYGSSIGGKVLKIPVRTSR